MTTPANRLHCPGTDAKVLAVATVGARSHNSAYGFCCTVVPCATIKGNPADLIKGNIATPALPSWDPTRAGS